MHLNNFNNPLKSSRLQLYSHSSVSGELLFLLQFGRSHGSHTATDWEVSLWLFCFFLVLLFSFCFPCGGQRNHISPCAKISHSLAFAGHMPRCHLKHCSVPWMFSKLMVGVEAISDAAWFWSFGSYLAGNVSCFCWKACHVWFSRCGPLYLSIRYPESEKTSLMQTTFSANPKLLPCFLNSLSTQQCLCDLFPDEGKSHFNLIIAGMNLVWHIYIGFFYSNIFLFFATLLFQVKTSLIRWQLQTWPQGQHPKAALKTWACFIKVINFRLIRWQSRLKA